MSIPGALVRSGLVVLAIATGACASAEEKTTTTDTWVGTIHEDDGDLSIALAVHDTRVALFICGDDADSDEYPGWFVGDATDRGFSMSREGWSVTATWTAESAAGTIVSPTGTVTTWTAPHVRDAEPSGLYTAADSGCTTGVIVTAGSDHSPTVRGAWCDADGNRAQVTPGSAIDVAAGRFVVLVQLQEGVRSLEVSRVHLPLP